MHQKCPFEVCPHLQWCVSISIVAKQSHRDVSQSWSYFERPCQLVDTLLVRCFFYFIFFSFNSHFTFIDFPAKQSLSHTHLYITSFICYIDILRGHLFTGILFILRVKKFVRFSIVYDKIFIQFVGINNTDNGRMKKKNMAHFYIINKYTEETHVKCYLISKVKPRNVPEIYKSLF